MVPGLESWAMGKTKVHMRHGQLEQLDKALRDLRAEQLRQPGGSAIKLQSRARSWIAQRQLPKSGNCGSKGQRLKGRCLPWKKAAEARRCGCEAAVFQRKTYSIASTRGVANQDAVAVRGSSARLFQSKREAASTIQNAVRAQAGAISFSIACCVNLLQKVWRGARARMRFSEIVTARKEYIWLLRPNEAVLLKHRSQRQRQEWFQRLSI